MTCKRKHRIKKGERCRKCRKIVREGHLEISRAQERIASVTYSNSKPFMKIFLSTRFTAKKRGVRFSLTSDDVKRILDGKRCVYCNRKVQRAHPMRSRGASLDRLIPWRGYTRRNVVLACGRCNRMKQDNTAAGMRHMAGVIEKQIKKLRRLP